MVLPDESRSTIGWWERKTGKPVRRTNGELRQAILDASGHPTFRDLYHMATASRTAADKEYNTALDKWHRKILLWKVMTILLSVLLIFFLCIHKFDSSRLARLERLTSEERFAEAEAAGAGFFFFSMVPGATGESPAGERAPA